MSIVFSTRWRARKSWVFPSSYSILDYFSVCIIVKTKSRRHMGDDVSIQQSGVLKNVWIRSPFFSNKFKSKRCRDFFQSSWHRIKKKRDCAESFCLIVFTLPSHEIGEREEMFASQPAGHNLCRHCPRC